MYLHEAINIIKVAIKDNQYRMDLRVDFSVIEEALQKIEDEIDSEYKIFGGK